jgi:hypothetical protein
MNRKKLTVMQTAVLFLVFNRPDTTTQVFEAIRKAKPPRLYVAGDGARMNLDGEIEKVNQVRKIATNVDWPCELKTLFREVNLGCKTAVSSAITWFFEHEEQGIILEDDCLPHLDFFNFCETLLERYANNNRVWVITGNNFQNGVKRGDASYYFSRYNHVWGWASWRRAWQQADMEIKFWPKWKKSKEWENFWLKDEVREYWMKIFDTFYSGKIDTWDYPWTACVWYYGGLTATPNVNLVSNIGFGKLATHTTNSKSPFSRMVTRPLNPIYHPKAVIKNNEADFYIFAQNYNKKNQIFIFEAIKDLIKKLKYLKHYFKKYSTK